MSHIRRSVAAFALSIAAFGALAPATANANNFVTQLAVSDVNSVTAVELGVGYKFAGEKFYVAPMVGLEITEGEGNSRYESQTQSNGTKVCRDMSNGQYSNKENCSSSSEGRGFVALEAGYRVSDKATIGLGVRRAEVTSPYGVVHFGFANGLKVRLAGGKDYASAGISVGF
jgi:hypothetical protein